MEICLTVIGGTDREIRFEFLLDDKNCGELQTTREQFTKLSDLLFGRDYKVVSAKHERSQSPERE